MTVKAIVEATAQVLVARGYESASTDVIAEHAGVSIGTLYQYFPNKESLVAELINQHVGDLMSSIEATLAQHSESPVDVALRAVIRAGVEAHRVDPALHKVLSEQVPRKKDLGDAFDVSDKIQAILEKYLRKRVPHLSQARTRMIAFVIESIVEALTHRAVIAAPDWLKTGQLELEALRLLGPYLEEALS